MSTSINMPVVVTPATQGQAHVVRTSTTQAFGYVSVKRRHAAVSIKISISEFYCTKELWTVMLVLSSL